VDVVYMRHECKAEQQLQHLSAGLKHSPASS
jgi:hypothetical protein